MPRRAPASHKRRPAGATSIDTLIDATCPLCRAADRAPVLAAPDTSFHIPGLFHVVRCLSCNMLYTSPRVPPSELMRLYPSDYSAHAPDRAGQKLRRKIGRDPWDRLPQIGRKRLLDVGCGSGAYLLRQREAGWDVTGVEPSHAAVVAAQAAGLSVIEGVVPGAPLPREPFDVVTMLAALPCAPDPLATLETLRTLLVPGGLLIVTAHNAGSNIAEVFGPDWQGWDLPRGQSHFTPDSLQRMLERAGFRHVRLSGKRRPSRWRHSARCRAERTGRLTWKCLARSRRLCSVLSLLNSRGPKSDEVVALATR